MALDAGAALLLAGTMTALLAGPSATPAHAEPDGLGFQSYLEQPGSSDVRPESATVLSGSVSNVRGITADGRGTTTLTVPPGGRPATILLDYGVEVEGAPNVDVESLVGTIGLVSLSLAFTEAAKYLRTPGSSTLAVAATAGATSVTVQPAAPRRPLTFAPDDALTVGSPAEVDRIVAVSGSTLTLEAPLARDHPAGAAVTSTPGAITADGAFVPRSVSLAVGGPGLVSGGFMGGFASRRSRCPRRRRVHGADQDAAHRRRRRHSAGGAGRHEARPGDLGRGHQDPGTGHR